ncbi:MAG: hypothetical protein DWI13_03015 [Planctomycetota bacterium]|nr:MAG: hypothetical protein DWH80_10680 [Planctomycetota bacterium]RLS98328.1 MAG: hypothetical protein DWI13_03015 [Planctomycetota bacterium]
MLMRCAAENVRYFSLYPSSFHQNTHEFPEAIRISSDSFSRTFYICVFSGFLLMLSLLWPIVLLLIGLGVMVLEVFLPSGGILGFVSIAAIVASIATAFFEHGPLVGMSMLTVAVLAVPILLALAFRWFPETPLGRRVLPPPPDAANLLPNESARKKARAAVGSVGVAVSPLLPWGRVAVGTSEFDAFSEDGPIDSGVSVDIVGVQGAAIVVRTEVPTATAEPLKPVEASLRPFQKDAGPTQSAQAVSKTLEDFDFDQIDRSPT